MEHGHAAAGQRIFSKMSNRMLYNQPADWVPAGGLPLNYEWMHGETGADNGGHPQGWNAACLMVGWRGHFGLRRLGLGEYSLRVRGVRPGTRAVLPLAPEHGFLSVAVHEDALHVTQLGSPSGQAIAATARFDAGQELRLTNLASFRGGLWSGLL